MSSSTRSITLPKLNVSKDMSLEKCEEHLSSYLQGNVTQRDDSSLIANGILKGTPMSNKAHAAVMTVSVNMNGILQQLANEVAAKVESIAHGNAEVCEVNIVQATWNEARDKITCKIHIESDVQADFDAYEERVSNMRNTNLKLFRKFGINANDGTLTGANIDHDVEVRMKDSIIAKRADVARGEAKLSSAIDAMLPAEIFSDMQQYVRQLEADGHPDADRLGSAKIKKLRDLYGASSNHRLVDQIYRYVQFLNMNRKQSQSLYDYTVSLRGKLQYMNRKTWTLDEMVVLLVYSDLLVSEEKTSNGVAIDYSTLKNEVRASIEANRFISPGELERKLYSLLQETIGGDNLVHRALMVDYERKRKFDYHNQNGSNGASGADKNGRKKKKKKPRFQPPTLENGKSFPQSSKCCFKCRRLDKEAGLPYLGWNHMQITGRHPHMANECKRKE